MPIVKVILRQVFIVKLYVPTKQSAAEGAKPETLEKDAPRKDDPITKSADDREVEPSPGTLLEESEGSPYCTTRPSLHFVILTEILTNYIQ